MSVRLSYLINSGMFALPDQGDVVVFGAGSMHDLSALPKARLKLVCRTKPDFDRLRQTGFDVVEHAPDHAGLAIVFLPRAKKQARALVARAMSLAETVVIDGQKTDGVDGVLKDSKVEVLTLLELRHRQGIAHNRKIENFLESAHFERSQS